MRGFSRNKDHREHMMRNLATSLVLYEKVDTTEMKAKELKSYIDHILASAKKADLNAIRALNKVFFDRNATKKVIEVLVPRYQTRQSGFTRSFKLKNRLGDNSAMMRVELVDKKNFVEEKETKKENSKTVKSEDKSKKDDNK